jgi:phage-related protein
MLVIGEGIVMDKKVNFYKTVWGNCPVEDFLNSLSSKQAQKVVWVLSLIEELKMPPAQYLKKLVNTDDIWEVRVQLGNNIFRLLGFLENEEQLILNHGFVKKTQKTPSQEIGIAESRKIDYFNQKK